MICMNPQYFYRDLSRHRPSQPVCPWPACLDGRRHALLPLLAPSLSVSLIYDNLMYSRQTRRTIHYRAVEKGANFTSCGLI